MKSDKSKTTRYFLLPTLILASFILLFSACFSPWTGENEQGTGSITISIGSVPASRAAVPWPPTSISSLTHNVRVHNNGAGFDQTNTISPANPPLTTTFPSVPAGSYTVEVQAFSSGPTLEAVGTCTVVVSGGSNAAAPVKMRSPVYIEPNSAALNRFIYWDGSPP